MSLIAVITTLPDRDQARRLARLLLERGLVACAQMETIESLYHWEGKLQQEQEIRLTLKAVEQHYPAIEAAIQENHPYELPAIHAIRLARVHPPYAAWINAQSPAAAHSCPSQEGTAATLE